MVRAGGGRGNQPRRRGPVQGDSCFTMYVGPWILLRSHADWGSERDPDRGRTTAVKAKDPIVARPAWMAPLLGP